MVAFLVVDAYYCVFKCRLFRVVDSLFYLFVVPSDAFHECFLIVVERNAVERYCVVGSIVWFKKRILSINVSLGCVAHTKRL